MLRRLYDWTMSLAARKSAEVWLAVIAFVESSVFLVPADVLYLPMALAKPERAYRYALVATVASVLGGIAGWALGYYAYDALARPVLEFYGKLEAFEQLRVYIHGEAVVLNEMADRVIDHLIERAHYLRHSISGSDDCNLGANMGNESQLDRKSIV